MSREARTAAAAEKEGGGVGGKEGGLGPAANEGQRLAHVRSGQGFVRLGISRGGRLMEKQLQCRRRASDLAGQRQRATRPGHGEVARRQHHVPPDTCTRARERPSWAAGDLSGTLIRVLAVWVCVCSSAPFYDELSPPPHGPSPNNSLAAEHRRRHLRRPACLLLLPLLPSASLLSSLAPSNSL